MVRTCLISMHQYSDTPININDYIHIYYVYVMYMSDYRHINWPLPPVGLDLCIQLCCFGGLCLILFCAFICTSWTLLLLFPYSLKFALSVMVSPLYNGTRNLYELLVLGLEFRIFAFTQFFTCKVGGYWLFSLYFFLKTL